MLARFSIVPRAGLAVFFLVHYGIFWLVHGHLRVRDADVRRDGERHRRLRLRRSSPSPASSRTPIDGITTIAGQCASSFGEIAWGSVLIGAAALFLSHGASFLLNYIGNGEYQRTSAPRQMGQRLRPRRRPAPDDHPRRLRRSPSSGHRSAPSWSSSSSRRRSTWRCTDASTAAPERLRADLAAAAAAASAQPPASVRPTKRPDAALSHECPVADHGPAAHEDRPHGAPRRRGLRRACSRSCGGGRPRARSVRSGVEEHDVGIAADLDRALALQPEQPGRRGRHELDHRSGLRRPFATPSE